MTQAFTRPVTVEAVAIVNDCLVTALPDGSVGINSRVLAVFSKEEPPSEECRWLIVEAMNRGLKAEQRAKKTQTERKP